MSPAALERLIRHLQSPYGAKIACLYLCDTKTPVWVRTAARVATGQPRRKATEAQSCSAMQARALRPWRAGGAGASALARGRRGRFRLGARAARPLPPWRAGGAAASALACGRRGRFRLGARAARGRFHLGARAAQAFRLGARAARALPPWCAGGARRGHFRGEPPFALESGARLGEHRARSRSPPQGVSPRRALQGERGFSNQ